MTVGGEGSVDVIVSVVGVGPGFSSLETRGVWEGGSTKSNDGTFGGGGVDNIFIHVVLRGDAGSVVLL